MIARLQALHRVASGTVLVAGPLEQLRIYGARTVLLALAVVVGLGLTAVLAVIARALQAIGGWGGP